MCEDDAGMFHDFVTTTFYFLHLPNPVQESRVRGHNKDGSLLRPNLVSFSLNLLGHFDLTRRILDIHLVP